MLSFEIISSTKSVNIEVVGHVCIGAHNTLSFVCGHFAKRDTSVSNVEDIHDNLPNLYYHDVLLGILY